MERFGVYVGTARLDYIQHFLSGASLCKHSYEPNLKDEWNINYELQHWIMTNQSACIRHACTLNGWSLFYRCFGSGARALMYFSKFLHDDIPKPVGAENRSPHEICTAYDIYNLTNVLCDDEKNDFETCKHSIIGIIRNMIEEKDEEYDEVRVYIHRTRYFSQIRFIYHTPNGWHDDADIIFRQGNYQNLIKLHAYLECVEDKKLHYLSEHQDRWYFSHNDKSGEIDVSDIAHTVTDKTALLHEHQLWKECCSCSY